MASIKSAQPPNAVISYKTRHGTSLISATGENILGLVTKAVEGSQRLSQGFAQLDEASTTPGANRTKAPHSLLWRALAQVAFYADASSETRSLARLLQGKTEEPVAVLPEWKQELLVWLTINPKPGESLGMQAPLKALQALASAEYADDPEVEYTDKAFNELSFLAPAREHFPNIQFESEDVLGLWQEYKVLMADNWKDEVLQDPKRTWRVLTRYVQFLRDVGGEDFSLEEVATSVEDFEFHYF